MKIKDICTFVTDGSHNPPQGIEKSEYMMLSSKNIFDDEITFDEPRFLSQKDFEREHKRTKIVVGDVLLTIVGTVGRTAVVDEDMPTFALQRSVAVLHPKNDVCLPRFLMYALRGKRTYIENRAKGVAQKGIYLKEVSDIDIYIPDISNQEIIINKLDKVNAVIKFRQEELLALDNLIKARFVELFGHQSHNEKSLPYMTIDDVAEIYLGITHTPIYVDSGVMFISAKNTSGDFLDLSDVKYISREEFEGAPKGSKPQVNDVLFSRVGSNLGHPVILEEELELCTFVSLGFLRSKGIVTSNYLKHWMRDEFFAKQVSEHVKGGGQPNLNTGWLKEFKIIVPGLEGQKEFDDFCKQVDKSKVAVKKALDETQMLFDSLMQKYFA